ncbi:C2 domain protein (macronuclear) [Tetrahymena thermophila SB210]|uniref:C2 domain protein n=1 Tax=Tetrahymena thermophila (strain SB210) TaxID=312017 RepID=I7LX79_TETTS|nr:C2 domain protein [Tetrahymena thermophila SB210]EAS03918.2 C2 domain protein [Tetrahymena thermophila SB210]|eukprot:XP_001024163.2 C2 domain protein [Tetrahymena thermophila SB210]
MSKGTFKITVKTANLTKLKEEANKIQPFAQIVFGEQVQNTKVYEGGGLNPTWNETFVFKKKDEYRLGIYVLKSDTGSKDDLIGMQEVGINSFIKKKSVVDHPVELMSEGAIIGEILLNIEFIQEAGPAQSWLNTNKKKKQFNVHKILITKIKANLEFESGNSPSLADINNLSPILKITMGKKTWRTNPSISSGKNLKWPETFNLVIETEQELSLEIVDGEQIEEKIGSAILKFKQIPQGSTSNKIPLILDGQTVGNLYFQSEYQLPEAPPTISLDDSLASIGRLASPYIFRPAKLIVSTIRVYLEKNLQVQDPQVLILWGSQIEKSSVLTDQTTSKPEWKELIVFNQSSFDNKIEVKLLDKNIKSEDDFIGYGYLILESSVSEGGKFRSQKIELYNYNVLQGQMYIDFEFKLENQGKDSSKNDPLDVKKKTKPTEEEIKKREILQKRRDLMKQSVMSNERNKSFLPQLDDNSNIFRIKTPAIRHSPSPPKPPQAIKVAHSISLPKINYKINVYEYNKLYKDSVFGLGMSNVHSAQSLRHSIPSFSISQAPRFPEKKYDGFDSFSYNAPSNFNGKYFDNGKFTKQKLFTPDSRYQIFHKSPTQKPGVSFGLGQRFQTKVDNSPGYYQGPQLLNYN